MYVESKNYDELYDLICQKNRVICEVDYKFSNGRVVRDICKGIKTPDTSIKFLARGIQYGGVDYWMVDNDEEEKQEFINECKRMNLVWFKP